MKLKFRVKAVREREYSTKHLQCRISELDLVRRFKHEMRAITSNPIYQNDQDTLIEKLNDRVGGFDSKIRAFKHIMMMDLDHKDFKNETSEELTSKGIAHTVIASSEECYWIIADVFKANRWTMADAMSEYVGVDPDYIRCCRKLGFVLRAYPRDGFVPKVIDRIGTGSEDYNEYIKAFEAYWQKPHIKWMIQEFLMNAI